MSRSAPYILMVLFSGGVLALTAAGGAEKPLLAAPAGRALLAYMNAPDPTSKQKDTQSYSSTFRPPEDAIMLFNGKDLTRWHQPDGRPAVWRVRDGVMTVGGGDIVTDETFTDAFLHLEFRTPSMPVAAGQEKGNSGVYLQGRYEIQVLDSYGFKVLGKGDCGAIYGQYAPLGNACKPPLKWQAYDVIFRAPRVDGSGKVTEPGRVTVLQNGMVIQNNVELLGPTAGAMDQNVRNPGPLLLQDHGSPVQYRNIWLVHLRLKGSDLYGPR